MDNYIEELVSIAKLPFNEISKDIKIISIGRDLVYVSNYTKILDYNTEKLILKDRKGIVNIFGISLEILQINRGEILIQGQITTINFGEKNEKI